MKKIKQIAAVGSIDTSGISMLEEIEKNMDRRGLKVQIYISLLIHKFEV